MWGEIRERSEISISKIGEDYYEPYDVWIEGIGSLLGFYPTSFRDLAGARIKEELLCMTKNGTI